MQKLAILANDILDALRHQRGRRTQPYMGTEFCKQMSIRSRDAAMCNVSDDSDSQIIQTTLALPYRVGIEQGLGRMFVRAISAIDDACLGQFRERMRRSGSRVPDNDAIRRHRVQRSCSVDERFALRDAACRGRDVHHVGGEAFARNLEREQGPRRIFEEGVDQGKAGEPVVMLGGAAIEL